VTFRIVKVTGWGIYMALDVGNTYGPSPGELLWP